ncbi:MAG: DUF1704 domain-containing protein [Proteobacteria bacterium]|nr:DUF1704 domain-containing protein [Pseudomonadota bacterium]
MINLPKDKRSSTKSVTAGFIEDVIGRLAVGRKVHRKLPHGGVLHIEGHLPFLIVHRAARDAVVGTGKLIVNETAYIAVKSEFRGLRRLISAIVRQQHQVFGAFLLVEVWTGPHQEGESDALIEVVDKRQAIRVHVPSGYRGHFAKILQQALSRLDGPRKTTVTVDRGHKRVRSMAPPLADANSGLKVTSVGIEIAPTWSDPQGGNVYPKELRELIRGFTNALRVALYEFACHHTQQCPIDFQVLGRSALSKLVWRVDEEIASVADSFDFLLQVTPVNAYAAWLEFQRNRCKVTPLLHYRPFPVDPIVLKRRLYAIGVERIDDPAISELFREKVMELDREISLVGEIESSIFLHGSLQLFGPVDAAMQDLALRILARLPRRSRDDSRAGYIDAEAFAARALDEIAYYKEQDPKVAATVQVRRDISSGLMVSSGNLLIGHETRIPAARAEALLQHEIGTHMLTYHNGRAQPLRQLYSGLAGYDELQEGLAVFAEYLTGGLSRPRLRLLAARVVGAAMMIKGAGFVEVFNTLHHDHGFSQRIAFNITIRLYRGGGLTKDAVYLNGLGQVITFLQSGGQLESLLIGKLALKHAAIMRELRLRDVVRSPRLLPRYLTLPGAEERLLEVTSGKMLEDLLS